MNLGEKTEAWKSERCGRCGHRREQHYNGKGGCIHLSDSKYCTVSALGCGCSRFRKPKLVAQQVLEKKTE